VDDPTPQPPTRRYTLEGERVALATLRREDVPTMHAWFSDLEYSALLGQSGFAPTVEDEGAWFEANAKASQSQVQFGIFERVTGRHVGNCGLFDIGRNGTATLGIGLGEPDARGRGYGTEAVRLLVEYGMFFRDLFSIKLECASINEPGLRAYLKAGFREVGRLRGAFLVGNERCDRVIMDITRDEVDLSRMRGTVGLLGTRT